MEFTTAILVALATVTAVYGQVPVDGKSSSSFSPLTLCNQTILQADIKVKKYKMTSCATSALDTSVC